MSEPNATPEVLAEAPVEEVKVEETAPAAEASAEPVVAEEVKEELNAVTESETSKEESPEVEIVEEKKESSEEPAVKSEEIPAVAELSRTWGAVTTDLEATRTELSRVQSDLAAARTEIESFKSELSKRDAELVDLRYLHRSVLSVMGLSASIEIPEIVEETPAMSVIEKYESMPAGAERLSFFQANRREIERSIAARLK